MPSVFRWIEELGPAGFVLEAILLTLLGIVLPLGYILARRAYRTRYFRRRDRRTLQIRKQWEGILAGAVKPETWRFDPLAREIVESILLDRLEVAPGEEAERLLRCLRSSGLLDMRIYEARHERGWRRRQALVSLGRMRAEEALPALAEALDSRNADTRVAALRGLGRMGVPAAAEPILERVLHGPFRVPVLPLQNALLNCCRSHPSVLLPAVRKADDRTRPLLARVLGEVATPELDEDLLLLASDPLPEVRASAARALAEAKPPLALTALSSLATDPEWFVRLRAVVALGALEDPRTTPVLVETLCDPNRHVRMRSASALARLPGHLEEILQLVIETRDRYALQALVSELERSGSILELVGALADPGRRRAAESALLVALGAGAHRLLLDALVHHPEWRARFSLARLLGRSGQGQLLPHLERLEAAAKSPREQRVLRWVQRELRESSPPGQKPAPVPA